jgi:hypothetical protein
MLTPAAMATKSRSGNSLRSGLKARAARCASSATMGRMRVLRIGDAAHQKDEHGGAARRVPRHVEARRQKQHRRHRHGEDRRLRADDGGRGLQVFSQQEMHAQRHEQIVEPAPGIRLDQRAEGADHEGEHDHRTAWRVGQQQQRDHADEHGDDEKSGDALETLLPALDRKAPPAVGCADQRRRRIRQRQNEHGNDVKRRLPL